jgi:Helix-turn-helix family
MSRKMWRTLEPYHGLIYFAPEATRTYEALGVPGAGGYFASRAAPMGAVPAEVVIATFFNFNPEIVHQAIPAAWKATTPEALIAARLDVADQALRRTLGDEVDGAGVARAAELARIATTGCSTAGRPLYAGHASLDWPEPPHLALWHAVSLLREFRGDGHIACLVGAGLDGLDALVFHAASGEVPRAGLQGSRQWDDDAWQRAVDGLQGRGLVDGTGSFTDAGAALRQQIEDTTDARALAPWEALGEQGCDELRTLVRPLSKTIVSSGTFGFG